jgi:hypothetical protein
MLPASRRSRRHVRAQHRRPLPVRARRVAVPNGVRRLGPGDRVLSDPWSPVNADGRVADLCGEGPYPARPLSAANKVIKTGAARMNNLFVRGWRASLPARLALSSIPAHAQRLARTAGGTLARPAARRPFFEIRTAARAHGGAAIRSPYRSVGGLSRCRFGSLGQRADGRIHRLGAHPPDRRGPATRNPPPEVNTASKARRGPLMRPA